MNYVLWVFTMFHSGYTTQITINFKNKKACEIAEKSIKKYFSEASIRTECLAEGVK